MLSSTSYPAEVPGHYTLPNHVYAEYTNIVVKIFYTRYGQYPTLYDFGHLT